MAQHMNVRSFARLALLGLVAMTAGRAAAVEGNSTPNARVPVAGIINPAPGAVTRPFRVQVRVISPTNLLGVAQSVTGATLYWTGPVNGNIGLTQNVKPAYGLTDTDGVWEKNLTTSQLTATGTYTLYARISNDSGSVDTAPVVVTVSANAGDGRLLVRDNADQLCSDCHQHKAHSSAEMGPEKYGSWYVGCRGCHQPHGTTNASLIATTIKPPQYAAAIPNSQVVFSNRRGYVATGGAANPSAASFANGDKTGVCQVCHTRTPVFNRNDDTSTYTADYHDGNSGKDCGSCHKHDKGLKASCNGCHGSATNNAPPVVAPAAVNPVANGGAHQAHVTQTNFTDAIIACGECHGAQDTAHPSGATTVAWGSTASANGVALYPPAGNLANVSGWSATPTCTNWCHGKDLPDGSPASKVTTWNWTANPTLGCGDCHGAPPAFQMDGTTAHSTSTTCQTCHPGYTLAGLTPEAKAAHINGTVEGVSCTGCHGDEGRTPVAGADANVKMAPPKDYEGLLVDDRTVRDIGAHTAHTNRDPAAAATLSTPLACAECHPVPNDHDTITPTASTRATMLWGDKATEHGARTQASITYNQASPYTCSNTYCHLPTPAQAGSTPTPSWTSTAGTLACTACHQTTGLTSGGHEMHVVNTTKGTSYNCATCHADVSNDNLSITDKALHVNATSDVVNTTSWDGSTCSSNQCHREGTENTLDYVPVAWATNTGVSCKKCHGSNGTSIAGEPDYTNNTGSFNTRNSHAKHVASAADCVTCHAGTVLASGTGIVSGGGLHLNNAQDVSVVAPITAYNSATESCTNTCHVNGSPLNGTPQTRTVVWGDTVGCTGCHSNRGADQGGALTDLSATHGKHLNQYSYTCDECHALEVADNSTTTLADKTLHANGARNYKFSTTLKSTTVNQASGVYAGSPGYGCTATYCHSPGNKTVGPFDATVNPTALNWTQAGSATCDRCHGGNAAATYKIASGAHTNHVNTTYANQNYGCVTCHNTTVTNDTTISAAGYSTNHVDGVRTVSVAGWVSPNCSSNACHSDGTETPTYKAPTWVAGNVGGTCNECHGSNSPAAFTATYGEPNYAERNSTGGDDLRNSHSKHVSRTDALLAKSQCVDCHDASIDATGAIKSGGSHLNFSVNITIGGKIGGYNATGEQCTNISCHGGNGASWGGPALTCADCHGGAADVPSWNFNDTVLSKINTGTEWTTYGHGSATVNLAQGKTGIDICLYCHDTGADHKVAANPFRLMGVTGALGAVASPNNFNAATDYGNDVCLNCHGDSGTGVDPDGSGASAYLIKTAAKKINTDHYGAKHTSSSTNGGQRCWDCHDPHGDLTNLAMIGADTMRTGSDAYGFTGTRSVNNAILTVQGPGGYATAASPATGICQVCHWNTNYYRYDGSLQTHAVGKDCVACHAHNQTVRGDDAFFADKDCTKCHNTARGARRAITVEFGYTWSHKRNGSRTSVNWDCIVCHMEGEPVTGNLSATHYDGVINLRDPDTGSNIKSVTFTDATGTSPGSYGDAASDATFTQFSRNLNSATLEPAVQAIMINQCLKCHDANGAASTLARVPTTGTAEKPFGTTIPTTQGIYYGKGGGAANLTANGVTGGVTNIKESFYTTNSSYHPILGKQNNWYARTTRMVAPWNVTRTGTTGNITSWGALMSCWDCHATSTDSGVITKTVTAHGSNETLRGNPFTSGTPAAGTAVTLCNKCHAKYNTCGSTGDACSTMYSHGAGSAFSSNTGRSTKGNYFRYACNVCHSSGYQTVVPRPIRGQDGHGMNALYPSGVAALSGRWSTDSRPYAFIRNRQLFGNHAPYKVGATTYTAGCDMSSTTGAVPTACTGQGEKSYTPGGTY